MYKSERNKHACTITYTKTHACTLSGTYKEAGFIRHEATDAITEAHATKMAVTVVPDMRLPFCHKDDFKKK